MCCNDALSHLFALFMCDFIHYTVFDCKSTDHRSFFPLSHPAASLPTPCFMLGILWWSVDDVLVFVLGALICTTVVFGACVEVSFLLFIRLSASATLCYAVAIFWSNNIGDCTTLISPIPSSAFIPRL